MRNHFQKEMLNNKWPSLRPMQLLWVLLVSQLLPVPTLVRAQTPELSIRSISLKDNTINALTTLRIQGEVSNIQIKEGDCFKLNVNQPYKSSKALYFEASGKTEFFVPFRPEVNYEVQSAHASASIGRLDDENLQVDIKGDAQDGKFDFQVNSIQNPFSQAQNQLVTVKHFVGCTTETACKQPKNCQDIPVTLYKLIETSQLPDTTARIQQPPGLAENVVATTNGSLIISFRPGTEFPQYGGEVVISVPAWFKDAATSDSVFSFNPKTLCSEKNGLITIINQQTSNFEHTIIYSEYKQDTPTELILTCTNYKNPTYAHTITGFRISLKDRESPPNLIAIYKGFSLEISSLKERELESELQFELYLGSGDTPSEDPMPIQSIVGLSIEFDMGPIPIDTSGCYVKYTFPNDIPLPANGLSYLSSDDVGKKMMFSSSAGINLVEENDYFIRNQEFSRGNYIVVKGCYAPGVQGQNQKSRIKFVGIKTPDAAKDTNKFRVEVYKNFDKQSYTFENLITFKEGFILQDRFVSGKVVQEQFDGLIKTIQTPKATHIVSFQLTNALPALNTVFDSRIVIKMPEKLSIGNGVTPFLKNLDGKLFRAKITTITDFEGCTGSIVCYGITHENVQDVPGKSILQFSLTGTTNQESQQEAGGWEVQTQIKELKTGNFFNIDHGQFYSKWTAMAGAIITVGIPTASDNYENYYKPATYTLNFETLNFIPEGGFMEVLLPKQVKLISSPFSAFSSNNPSLVATETFTENSFKLKAQSRVASGRLELKFGGVENPNSFMPTDIFKVNTTDSKDFAVSFGNLDNIAMRKPAPFDKMTIVQVNKTNGAITDYKVSFKPTVPLLHNDIFTVFFPPEIVVPRDPLCSADKCLTSITCSGELGKIIVQFSEPCAELDVEVAFTLSGIKNPPSLIPSSPLTASWTNARYREVAQFSGNLIIQNEVLAFFDPGSQSIHQQNTDFDTDTIYTINFRPHNAIHKSGWVMVKYPLLVQVKDEQDFITNCQILTLQSYIGSDFCNIITSKREIWIYNVFRETETFSSIISMEFKFTNPRTNFFEGLPEEDLAFQITTFAFPPNEILEMKNNEYSQGSVNSFINRMKPNPEAFAKGSDTNFGNDLQPVLKCDQPCFTCLDNDPAFCTSCWGPGDDQNALNPYLFMIAAQGKSTCKKQCDNKYSVNGNMIETKGQDGKVDDTATFFMCEDCDSTCNSCQGQFDKGEKGDKIKCLTCAPSFKFFNPTQQTCQTTCSGGYYSRIDIPWTTSASKQSECAKCEAPCTSCRACNPDENNCDGSDEFAGAKYCTGCDLDKFVPMNVDDVESVIQYMEQELGMINQKQTDLGQSQQTFIENKFNRQVIKIKEFLKLKLYSLPDGTQQQGPLSQTGLVVPGYSNVNADTTYRSLYQDMYNQYNFPLASLLQGRCLKGCPDGFASVNGLCKPCKAPCATCRINTNKCLSCLQNQAQPYIYGRSCYEECPIGTVLDPEPKVCLSCDPGCDECNLDDQSACLRCSRPLLLLDEKCYGQCPTDYRQNFWRTRCYPDVQMDVIHIPLLIFAALIFVICVSGKYSSKNIYGLHNVFLSFYALAGCIDVLALWVQVVLTFVFGDVYMIIVPLFALGANYYLNWKYYKLWNIIDPPKPVDNNKLSLKEVQEINECDQHFDYWNEKYADVADSIKKLVVFWSHKFFSMPFTHFYGYFHLTLRIQNNMQVWEWDLAQWKRWKGKGISNRMMLQENFSFVGRLTDRLDDPIDIKRRILDQTPKEPTVVANPEQYEGGKKEVVIDPQDFNPLTYVQSPISQGNLVPDNRIHDLFKEQVKIDLIFIRIVMIIGNIILLTVPMADQRLNQLHVACIECIIFGFLMTGMQVFLYKKWEQNKLPVKMKDQKSNYLFRRLNYPGHRQRIEDYLDGITMEGDHDYEKYLKFYNMPEMFLDNKLEELLNVFGKRQTKSCCEFPTGTEYEEDPRLNRSFPLSPRGEEIYKGMDGEFNMVDFVLDAKLYGVSNEPSVMFQSVNRDYSDFGHDPFDANIMHALSRKGGNLVSKEPGENLTVHSSKKKRGRKNRYYRLIDVEDEKEANKHSQSEDGDDLDKINEEDYSGDDDEEIAKKRMELEAKRKLEGDNAEQLRQKQANKALQDEILMQQQLKKQQELDEKNRKAKEIADKKQKIKDDKLRKEEAERKKREELERLRKEEEAEAERRRREQEERDRLALEAQQREKLVASPVTKMKGSRNQTHTLETKSSVGSLIVRDGALNDFQNQVESDIIEIPPNAMSRRFNENDIQGDLDRDEKGNIIIDDPDKNGTIRDKRGRLVNSKGYLIDQQGNIINNFNNKIMFPIDEIDEFDEIPPPFSVEKHGFNPHLIRGYFDYDFNGKAIVLQDINQRGLFRDKKGMYMSQRGYRVDGNGNIIDVFGIVKIHFSHLTSDGDLPKLFNYDGRRFNITDVIGQLEKDDKGILFARQDKSGFKHDLLNRRVNTHGYLTDEAGNVIDKGGKIIFLKRHLVNEEIPKIFPFSKFNIKTILADFELDPLGVPILKQAADGGFQDLNGKKVNSKGYYLDPIGNVIDSRGFIVFFKNQLETEGDIPKVYRTGLLKASSESSLSRLMSEIGKNASDTDQKINDEINRFKNGGEMSGDGYGTENEDLYGTDEDIIHHIGGQRKKLRKKKKKLRKKDNGEWIEASLREHLLAGAYGGIAKPKPKRAGLKYTTDIDAGLRDIATPQIFRETHASNTGRKMYKPSHANSNSGGEDEGYGSGGFPPASKQTSRRKNNNASRNSRTQIKSQMASIENKLLDPNQKNGEILMQDHYRGISKKELAQLAAQRRAKIAAGEPVDDEEFEKLFGQDIEQFLDDSEWEIDSVEGDKKSYLAVENKSMRSNQKLTQLKNLEKQYLPRQESLPKGIGVGGLTPLQQNGHAVLLKSGTNLTVSTSSLPKPQVIPKFRGNGTVYEDNDGPSRNKQKKAWDSQSRNSQQQLTGSSASKVFKAHK